MLLFRARSLWLTIVLIICVLVVDGSESSVDEKSGNSRSRGQRAGGEPDFGSGTLQSLAIEGGEVAYLRTNPWMAGLFLKHERTLGPFCGGSLIHEEYVITAAHCVNWRSASDIIVSLGDFDWTRKSLRTVMPPQLYQVHDISRHKYHYKEEQIGLWSDLAILHLERPVETSDRVKVIRLAEEGETFEGEIATVTGWGDLSLLGPQAAILQKLEVKVINDPFPETSPADLGALRAGNDDGSEVCQEDSGAPLSVKKEGEDRLIGVLSKSDRSNISYGIYMRISHYNRWILDIIKNRAHKE